MRANPYQFNAFAHAIREGSFSRAAIRMGISQSAVSQHIAKLERETGAKLLLRRADGLVLTKVGQEFYELADRLATLDALIEEKIEGYAKMSQGYLSIIANAPRPALEFIARFQRVYPDIEIDFTLHDWTGAMALLRNRQVDIGIVTEPDRIGACVTQDVGSTRYVAYVPRDHPFASQSAISLSEFAAETVLIPEEGSFTARILQEKFQAAEVTLQRRIRTTTFPVMKEAILHGVGIGIFLADSAFPDANLTTVRITEMPEAYQTQAVCPQDKRDLSVVKSFFDVLPPFAGERI